MKKLDSRLLLVVFVAQLFPVRPAISQGTLDFPELDPADSSVVDVISIALQSLDSTWSAAQALVISALDTSSELRTPRLASVYDIGDFNDDGHTDIALTGSYEKRDDETGRFLLIVTQAETEGWRKEFLAQVRGAGRSEFVGENGQYLWWTCSECDSHMVVNWLGGSYGYEWLAADEPRPGTWTPVIDFKASDALQQELRRRCDPNRDSSAASCRIQDITEAADPGAHRDDYALRVEVLPTHEGRKVSAPELLRFVRLNFREFLDSSFISLVPASDADLARWNSDSPEGAFLYQRLFEEGVEVGDGLMVVADASDEHLVLATLWTQEHGHHPLSGVRRITISSYRDGAIITATGIVRVTEESDLPRQGALYRSEDRAWFSFIDRLNSYIEEHGGKTRYIDWHSGENRWDFLRIR